MMSVTKAFIRGGKATSNQSKRKGQPWKQSDFQKSRPKQGFERKEFRQRPRDKGVPGAPESRSKNKYCDFHGDKGHNTDDCLHLKRQTKEDVRSGHLAHLIKEIKEGCNKASTSKRPLPPHHHTTAATPATSTTTTIITTSTSSPSRHHYLQHRATTIIIPTTLLSSSYRRHHLAAPTIGAFGSGVSTKAPLRRLSANSGHSQNHLQYHRHHHPNTTPPPTPPSTKVAAAATTPPHYRRHPHDSHHHHHVNIITISSPSSSTSRHHHHHPHHPAVIVLLSSPPCCINSGCVWIRAPLRRLSANSGHSRNHLQYHRHHHPNTTPPPTPPSTKSVVHTTPQLNISFPPVSSMDIEDHPIVICAKIGSSRDGVRDPAMASGRGRLKEDLESSMWRHVTTSNRHHREPPATTYTELTAMVNKLLKIRHTIDSLLSKTINELTNQFFDVETFFPRERIKKLKLRMQQKNNFEEELFKDMFHTEEKLAYHKELLGSVIDGRLSEVALGKPFVQASKLTYDESLGLIRFAHRDEEVVFMMPQRKKELDLVSPLEKDKFEAFFVENLKVIFEEKKLGSSYKVSLDDSWRTI
nr:retrotransposon Gag domain-containing protein [Tanacetum cinerariifolium]